MYYESSPGLQYLHSLKNDSMVVGGESIFLDSFKVAQDFREKYPELFYNLTRLPATFQKIHFEIANKNIYLNNFEINFTLNFS